MEEGIPPTAPLPEPEPEPEQLSAGAAGDSHQGQVEHPHPSSSTLGMGDLGALMQAFDELDEDAAACVVVTPPVDIPEQPPPARARPGGTSTPELAEGSSSVPQTPPVGTVGEHAADAVLVQALQSELAELRAAHAAELRQLRHAAQTKHKRKVEQLGRRAEKQQLKLQRQHWAASTIQARLRRRHAARDMRALIHAAHSLAKQQQNSSSSGGSGDDAGGSETRWVPERQLQAMLLELGEARAAHWAAEERLATSVADGEGVRGGDDGGGGGAREGASPTAVVQRLTRAFASKHAEVRAPCWA
jgi:hypothetical protein